MAEAAPVANFVPALEELAPGGQPQELVQEASEVVIPVKAKVGEPMYEHFRCQKPPTFNGSTDPIEVEDWLKKVQRIFVYMKLEDHEKLAYAVNQLEREALYWWEYMAGRRRRQYDMEILYGQLLREVSWRCSTL